MKYHVPGVEKAAEFYFGTPSDLAKNLFYYCICASEFYCRPPYHTKRDNYNSFLFIEILDGDFRLKTADKIQIAGAGDFIILNCYEPHEYLTQEAVHFRFFHFDGNSSEDFYQAITRNHGNIIRAENIPAGNQLMDALIQQLTNLSSHTEGAISGCIHQLLCALLYSSSPSQSTLGYGQPIENALIFMEKNYHIDIKIEDIAKSTNLSVYYFSRLFKKITGYAPYEYLINHRISKAKKLLKTSQKTISEIGFLTGFQSDSSFISCFNKKVGMTPGNFRQLPF